MEYVFSEQDRKHMAQALEEAKKASLHGDVPVGAVLIDNKTGNVLAKGPNTREVQRSVLGHAELNVIHEGCDILGDWRLTDCTLYVTLEPCPMCAGAILHARVPRVVYGATDPVAGAMGSVWALHAHPTRSKHIRVECGCMEEECMDVLRDFFRRRRDTAENREGGEEA
jgi:tRNA(adenine34) deaminase